MKDRLHEWDEDLLREEMLAAAEDENRLMHARGDIPRSVPTSPTATALHDTILDAIQEAGRITTHELAKRFPDLPKQQLSHYTGALVSAGRINRLRYSDPVCYEAIPGTISANQHH
jgi:hypothetical protein